MNEADSRALAQRLANVGLIETDKAEDADVIILNTCCVRQASEDKVYSKLANLRRWKRPGRVLALTGCLGVKEKESLRYRFPYLDEVIPIGEYDEFVEKVAPSIDYSEGEPLPLEKGNEVTHYITIITGCNRNCTFCIVPFVRGREKSRPMQQILQECQEAVSSGVKEVIFLGQNVDDYKSPDGEGGLSELLRRAEKIDGLLRIRFMTSHPRDMEDDLLDVMASSDKICRELQLPVQSGDDFILKRMARGYLKRDYMRIIERARTLMPDIAIATDIIVGFPDETEERFLNTLKMLEEVEFDVVHVAMFSPRPGTVAAKWTDNVPWDVKRERLNRILDLQRAIARRKMERWVGHNVQVLIEGYDANGHPYGRSSQGKRVVILKGKDNVVPGQLVEVRVERASAGQLAGNLVA